MIGYVTLGTNDLDRAAKFYDQVLAVVGAKRGMKSDRFISWTGPSGGPMLMTMKPHDGKPATGLDQLAPHNKPNINICFRALRRIPSTISSRSWVPGILPKLPSKVSNLAAA